MMRQALCRLSGEWNLFRALPRNARILLGTSTLFVVASPVIAIFIAAYIMRNSQDVVKVMAFQLASFTGVPLTIYLNGLLLRRVNVAALYAFGLVLSGLALLAMTALTRLDMTSVVLVGLVMGMATGFHWANRNLLSFAYTHDGCRNYYFGLEGFFYCASGVVMPTLVGTSIACWTQAGMAPSMAYRTVALATVVVALCATFVLLHGDFSAIRAPVFTRLRFDPVWRRLMALAALKGCVQVFQTTVPAMLVMRVAGGGENALGLVQSAGALLAAVLLYLIGRNTRPEHRLAIWAVALILNVVGAGYHAVGFNSVAVMVFIVCLLVAQPMLEWAYSPIQLLVLDRVAVREKDSEYAYLCGHELGLYAGRLMGAGAFILVARAVSDATALRYVLALVAVVQLLSYPIASSLVRKLKVSGDDCAA